MLPSHTRSHREYVDFVSGQKYPLPARHLWVMQALFLCDLTIVRFMMFFTYSMFGRPAWPPEDIFRSMLAMVLCGITSFDVWVTKMREESFYAVISGFHPENVPGIGTFYDFTDRIRGRRCAVVRAIAPRLESRMQVNIDYAYYGVLPGINRNQPLIKTLIPENILILPDD